MIVTLDNERLQTDFANGCTLEQVLERVKDDIGDRLIVSVALNGEQQSDQQLSQLLSQPMPDNAQLDLESGNARELVSSAMDGLALEFSKAGQETDRIVDLLTSGDTTAGIQAVGQQIALWQTCQRVVAQSASLLNLDLTDYVIQERPLRTWLEEVIDRLVEVRNALESRDLVMLTDLVRYEIPELSRTWEMLLRELAQSIRQAA